MVASATSHTWFSPLDGSEVVTVPSRLHQASQMSC